jgi:hypothetical protein
MKMKLITLMTLVAVMMALVPAPAFAQQFRFDGDRDHFFNRGGGVSFEIGDAENRSGDIETENNFAIKGNNNNACLGQLQFGQTGNFTNQQGALQFGEGAEFDRDHGFFFDRDRDRFFDRHRDHFFDNNNGDLEFEGPEITFAPQNETVCEQAVQQSAAASSWWGR